MGDFRDQQRYDAHQEALRNSRRAKQRAAARTTQRKRRVVLVALLLLPVAVAAFAFTWSREQPAPAPVEAEPAKPLTSQALAATGGRVPMPDHIRGVHVTSYAVATPSLWEPIINLADPGVGMNSIQIDIKDERGEVAFTTPIPTARDSGAHMNVYDPVKTLREAHQRGLYVIGRIVTFQDGYAPRANPGIAIKRKNGKLWENDLGITWLDPSDEEAWEYPLQLAAYAAELGFDEIMFDYVRYPTDGDLESARLSDPGRNKDEAITSFLKRASRELKPRGVRVSAAFFGLAASEDLGIGQKPGKLRNTLDAFYPMIYPSHFGAGQFNIDDPDGTPGPTIAAAMADWRRRTNGGSADLRPWLQDFTMGEHEYGLAEVKEQIAAAEATGAGGWLLWNAQCIYTPGVFEGTAGQP
ncbi:MAG: putative glycoside hydrolase [Actinomycetota bacterium]